MPDNYIMLNSYFTFGQYRGRKVADICVEDPRYVLWAADTWESATFDSEVIEEAVLNDNSTDRKFRGR